ncbi:Uu.00g114380.m01.CDS01 [Anthostomella pinea]|uniref:Uu.00g114380.m01.CDS01 n=1 Tax=Anthostomella pinea TaxID=933095 RepID=A0AAI8VGQ2_9PEZI|nr:Uu.00g114380.m01.CDS01 [Anthostomella pinea]
MAYETSARPPGLTGLIPLGTLPSTHIPSSGPGKGKQLIIIGDVHGQLSALEALLSKTAYSAARGDHVVFTGDMINKGADSAGVVARAMAMGASAVRGNHEDRVLLAWENSGRDLKQSNSNSNSSPQRAGSKPKPTVDGEKQVQEQEEEQKEEEKAVSNKTLRADLATAASLTPEQRAWLAQRPVILQLGHFGARYGDVVVVHAGLAPNIPLQSQDLHAVMTMRTLVYPAQQLVRAKAKAELVDEAYQKAADHHQHSLPEGRPEISISNADIEARFREMLFSTYQDNKHPDLFRGTDYRDLTTAVPSAAHRDEGGRPWAETWNEAQLSLANPEKRMTVVYGHDAKAGLNVREYAIGLDSGCVRGGELTAVVFEFVAEDGEGSGNGKGGIRHRLVSVACEERPAATGSEGVRKKGGGEKGGGEKKKSKDKEKDKENEKMRG